jgi:type II secretory pathway pseudopilin PulG
MTDPRKWSGQRHRPGFTLVEALIAALVGCSVIGTAWILFTSTARQEHKAQGLAAAAQAGAQVFFALENDFANIRPNGAISDTVATTTTVEGDIELVLLRRTPNIHITFDQPDYNTRTEMHVTYRATPDDTTKLYHISRYVTGHPDLNTTFPGAAAKFVRFVLIQQGLDYFLRVSMLLIGDEADQDKVADANRAKPLLVSSLYRVPISPSDRLTGVP